MSWNDIKKKYGNSQISNNSSNDSSSWKRIKNKYSQIEKQKKEKEEEQKKLIEKLTLPTKAIQNNPTVAVPNTNSKQNDMTNVRNSMVTSLSEQLANATTTNDKGIVTSISDVKNRIKADEKNKNIAKGGVDAVNEYLDSTLNAIPGGTMSVFSGITNAGTSLAGAGVKGLQNLTNNENVEEKLQETYDKIIKIGKDIHQKGNSTNLVNSYVDNDFTRESSNLVHTVSSQLTTYGLSLATGVPAPVIQGTYVGGSSAQEVLNENKDNIGRAVLTGVGKGLTSYGVEKLTGGNILGKGSFDDGAVKFIAENFKSKTGQKIASKIYEIGGEVIEENLENALDMVIDNVVNKKGYTVKDWWNELGETSKGTVLATIALNLLGLGGDTYNRVQQYKLDSQAKKMIKEAESLIEKENLKIDFDIIKQNNKNTDTNPPPQSTQNVQNTHSQQVVPMQQENAQNTNIKQILSIKNNSIQTYEESAKKYNIDTNNETVKSIDRITRLRGINASYNADLFSSNDANAIWRTHKDNNGNITREVILNPNADTKKALQNIIVHELTHDFEGTTEYKELKDLILSYDAGNVGFEKARESLGEIYSKVYDRNSIEFQSLIDNEAVADILGNKLGTQEFIDTLTMQKPTTARKIYNWIIDKLNKLNKLTGYTNEKLFWQDVKNKFENAYRQDYKGSDIATKFDIITKGNKQYVKATRQVISGNDPLIWEQQVENYINETIRNGQDVQVLAYDGDILSITKDTAGKAKFRNEVIDKNGNKRRLNNKEFMAKLRAETHIDELAETSKHKQGPIPDTKNHSFAKDGFTYRTAYFEDIDGTYYRITMSVGKNGSINTIYNIGKMQNWQKNRRHSISELKGSSGKTTSDRISSTNSITSLSENVNTTQYSMQESENNSGSFNLPKLKEGYTRLYRGLENEYDANYDKSKLDNSNGYESWTDNYELAKAYGDNVYYIDVPSSEVKNSIIDEDSQSETYGDRNLLYKNDKPVGIKGKSGNEYMLYTDHDNYRNIRYNKIDSNNSTQDNQGRTLTKEQQEYFKDSKVRDENGNLLTMYHGTPNGDYTVFKDGTYFSPRKEYADGYQNTWASAISTKQNANNPKTYEVYLNITNPFTLQNPKAKKIYLNEFIKGGNSLSYDPYTDWTNDINNLDEIDWTEAEDLREWLLENHPEYDGLILDEGGDGGYGEAEYRWRGKSFVPFNANQIKNVDNTNPTNNSDIRYSLPTKEWQQYLDDNYKPSGTRTNLEDIRLPVKENNKFPVNQEAEIANILQKPQEKVKEKDRSWAIAKTNLIDKGIVFEELSRKTGNRELQGKWDYTLTSTARGQNAIGNARYELDPKTKTQKQISKSLTDIIAEVGENTADFYSYMYHQLNIDRMTLEERFNGDTGINYERRTPVMNKPVFGESVSAQMSRQTVAELEKKYPEFKEYAQDVYDYLDANTKELVDNGVISKETQQLFKDMYPHYVPISRVRNKGQAINVPLDTGRTGINSPIKKATGGSSDINPLFETMADRTLQTYRASARNSFGVELKNTLGKTNQVSERTDIDTIMENMTDEEQNKQLLQEGKNGENPTFTVFENGNKVTYEITKDMYDALKPKNELLSKIDDNKVSKIANKVNNFRRGLLTEYNPVFSITNAIKDSQDILLNSQHSAKTYAKIPEATAQILSKGYWYNEYIQNGGSQNSYFKDGEFETAKNNLPTKIKNTLTIPLKAISKVNNVIEMTPRLAEYIVSREQGRSIETSMLDAARVTTNFKAGGDITKTLNRNGFTFLNASVQGMQQQIRNVQEANAKGLKGYAVLACKYAIAGVPVLLLNNLLWADDDEYEELQDYVKDNYYIIGKLPNGKFLRIPKGRAVATIQKIVSNVNKFVKNNSINSDEVGKIFWEDMKENIQFGIENLAPNNPMENNVLSPIFQALTNKTWYGDDLVPTRLQNKPKAEQYDETTDNFSRWLGEKTGISPIKINYLIDQYSGGAGDVLLPLGTPQAENNVIEDKFTTDATMKSKYPGEFFTKVDELEINKNSSKATDEDILKYKYISSVSTDMGKLYTKKREIQNSSVTDKEKKAQLKEVQAQINKLAKNSLENVDRITKGKNYAQIDTKQYYKDIEGEWKSVSKKDSEKNKKSGLSLKTYSSYKYEMSKLKQEKVSKGQMTEEQNLKDNEQIQILLDSNYSDKDKTIIYEDYIKSSVKEGEYDSFKVIKASGININDYLKYEQQEFKSDKDDDGTLTGKTVSKSKQKKVVEYLNSNITKGNQRLLLYAMQGYSMTSAQKTQLVNYVQSLKIDKDTRLQLYDKFSGFTVYKDGTIKY